MALNVAANIARTYMIIVAIVAILQLLQPGISGNKSILRQYCHNNFILVRGPSSKKGYSTKK